MSNKLSNNPEYLSGEQMLEAQDDNENNLRSNPMMQGNNILNLFIHYFKPNFVQRIQLLYNIFFRINTIFSF